MIENFGVTGLIVDAWTIDIYFPNYGESHFKRQANSMQGLVRRRIVHSAISEGVNCPELPVTPLSYISRFSEKNTLIGGLLQSL